MHCPICCEELKGSIIPVELRGCAHVACQGCLVEWIQTCEQNHLDVPTCPECRRSIPIEETGIILGRTYAPSTFRAVQEQDVEQESILDELTREWLTAQEAKMCRNCGAWITLEDGCDAVQCLCGYQFCWGCGLGRNDCECGCGFGDDEFFDNVLGDHTEWEFENVVANSEEILDLRSFLDSYRQRYNDWMENGDTTLNVVMLSPPEPDIWTACKLGDLDLVMSMLANNPELLEAEYNSRTPLYYASLCGHSNIVSFLLAKGAKDWSKICYQVALNQECRRLLRVSRNNVAN